MIHWNTPKLAGALKAGKLNENEKMSYLLLVSILTSVSVTLIDTFKIEGIGETLKLIVGLIHLPIIIIGTFIAFRANTEGDNQNFIERVICLSWPLLLKLLLATLIISVPLLLVFEKDSADIALVFCPLVLEVAFYWRLIHWIKIISPRRGS